MTGEAEAQMEALYTDYQTAIKAGQVEEVLMLGKLYYNVLRGGEMTCEDREQLQKDLLICVSKRDRIE